MIQDIGNHKWRIEYKTEKPAEDSQIMFFEQDTLLVIHQGENTITYPKYKEISEHKETSKYSEKLTYLFELDGIRYYRKSLNQTDGEAIKSYLEANGDRVTFEKRHFFRQVRPNEIALVSITGMHLNGWYQKSKYCGECGNKLTHDSKERMMRCPDCSNMVFPRINPAVIVAVTNGNKILVTRYKDREYKNLALIAGFNEIGESFEQTVEREVMEEAGLKVKNIRYYKSQPWGFTDNILVGYFCEVEGDIDISMDEEELSMAKWLDKSEIPANVESLSLTWEMIKVFADRN